MAARQFKQGLDYFPLDINFFNNDKIQLIEAEYGCKGAIIALRLLSRIYANGYYYQWGEDECLLFARAAGGEFASVDIDKIVKELVRRRFFDKDRFETFAILTSRSIQEIYLEACGRRKSVDIVADYWLIDYPTSDNVNILSLNDDIYEQRKEKGKKKEKVKENKNKKPAPEAKDQKTLIDDASIQQETEEPDYEKLVEQFNKQTEGVFGHIRMPLDENRRKQIRQCIREFGNTSFTEMIEAVARSNFLKGDNKRCFKATFDWMIKTPNYQKIIEGNYENNKKQTNGTNQLNYSTIAERVRSESDVLRQALAAKYKSGQ